MSPAEVGPADVLILWLRSSPIFSVHSLVSLVRTIYYCLVSVTPETSGDLYTNKSIALALARSTLADTSLVYFCKQRIYKPCTENQTIFKFCGVVITIYDKRRGRRCKKII